MPNPVVSCDRYRVKFFLSFSDNSDWWPGTTGMWIKSRITDFSCSSFLVIEIIWDHKLLKFRWLITEPRCVFCWQTDVGFQTNLSVPGKKKRRGRRKVFLKAFFFFLNQLNVMNLLHYCQICSGFLFSATPTTITPLFSAYYSFFSLQISSVSLPMPTTSSVSRHTKVSEAEVPHWLPADIKCVSASIKQWPPVTFSSIPYSSRKWTEPWHLAYSIICPQSVMLYNI